MEEQKNQERQKQTVFDPAKVIAIGIASPAAGFLTSRFGVAGTLIGLALSAMILTAVADFLKVYLARTSHAAAHAATHATHVVTHTAAATDMPRRRKRRGLPARLFRQRCRAKDGSKAPYHGFSGSPAPARRWALLVGRSIVAAGLSLVLALGVVTAIEHSAGKSLACWVWQECPAESSSTESSTEEDAEPSEQQSTTTTLPSILGGGPSAGNEAPSVRPAADGGVGPNKRPVPNDLGAPEELPSPLEAPSEAVGSGGTDSETAGWSGQQQSPSYERQEASYYYPSEEYEEPPSNISPSSSDTTEDDQNGAPPDTEGKTRGGGYEVPLVPWTT